MDLISALPAGVTGFALAAFLLAGLFTAMYKGAVIPRPHHEDRIADKDKQIGDLTEANRLLVDAIKQSKENDETIIQLLEGMQGQYVEGTRGRSSP